MSYGYRISFGPPLSPAVKYLAGACVVVFIVQVAAGEALTVLFGLTPYLVVNKLFLWQLATYLFLHGGLLHLLFNMLGLWMFGAELERYLGSRRFLRFFFFTGVGAGLLSAAFHPGSTVPTIGASGAIYGILAAYGMLFPERLVFFYFFPMRAKYLVLLMGAMAFAAAVGSSGTTVDHIAHLGGMAFGFLYLKGWLSLAGLRAVYHRWKINRIRRRFKVHESSRRRREDDFWIN